jgi:hypothetical protein
MLFVNYTFVSFLVSSFLQTRSVVSRFGRVYGSDTCSATGSSEVHLEIYQRE